MWSFWKHNIETVLVTKRQLSRLSVVVSIILAKVYINLEHVSWYLHVFLEVAASLPNIEVVVGGRAAILMGGNRLRFTCTNTQQHLVHLCI